MRVRLMIEFTQTRERKYAGIHNLDKMCGS